MKKVFFAGISILTVLSVTLFSSCKGKTAAAASVSDSVPEYKERKIIKLDASNSETLSYSSMKDFFDLDFTPEYPDEVFSEKSKNAAAASGRASGGASGTSGVAGAAGASGNNKKSESVIPGIRKLSEYITKYTTKKAVLAEYNPKDEAEEKDDGNKEFFIEDWGPQDKIVAGENNPAFYVIFSRPVHSLKALSQPEKTSDIMSIEPALPGTFRWYGTKHLSFEADVPPDPTVSYTIKIKSDLKSSGGKVLTGKTEFKTVAEDLLLTNLWGGYIKESLCAYNYSTGALPPYENRFVIRTNYRTTLDAVKQNLKVAVNGAAVRFEVKSVYEDIFKMWSSHADYDEQSGRSNTYLVEITDEVPHNAVVAVSTASNASASGVAEKKLDFGNADEVIRFALSLKNDRNKKQYYTLKTFKISRIDEMTGYSGTKNAWPLQIRFTQIPDKQSLIDNLSLSFDYKLTEDNIIVRGQNVTLCNLPLKYNQSYAITFNDKIKDKYGQNIALTKQKYEFKTPEEKAYVKYQNHGTTMLEAQFPHKMLFEHQNLTSLLYTLGKTDRPSGTGEYHFNETEDVTTVVTTEKTNLRNFEELDLEPFLTNGYGFVHFKSSAKYDFYNRWQGKYEETESGMEGVVQVTDLGITARLSINKAVVMVRSLSTGKPVEGAEVMIVHDLNDYSDWNGKPVYKKIFVYGDESTYDKLYAKGKTDKDGLCVIDYTEEQVEKIQKEDEAFVYVVKGDDKAVFAPSSHNSWREGVSTGYLSEARKSQQRTFMFVDRGIYKPGEIVTFRGIDRDQLMGFFSPRKGKYTIKSNGAWWNSPDIIEPIEGELSESGGFYGSFKLPEDLKRGYYNLEYIREGSTQDRYSTAKIQFAVADFERVKFESSIKVPEITYYGGDKLSATLSASYLAGGTLSGVSHETSWFKSETTFKSSDPRAKGYTFATSEYPRKDYYKSEKGTLDMEGKANLSCSSEKITDGKPYIYHIESAVTDVSNQRIASSNDIFVHPALFYIGLAKAKNIRGFAKSGQTVEIPYILVKPDGSVLETQEVMSKVSGIEYKLSHEEWTMVHEQSVDDTIYERYQKQNIEDLKGEVKAESSGTISFVPKVSGWYTLTVTGKDSKNNAVAVKSEFYVTGSSSSWFDQYNSNSIKLTPDKNVYNPGETAQILLESPLPSGDYLITVEREGIFTEEVRHFENGAEVIEVPVAGNFVPVVYVSVSSYSQRHGKPEYNYGEVDIDKPKGYYGVTPVMVNPYVRSFSVEIECDKPSYRPGETAVIKFKATKGGKPLSGAELTAMAVDRGVLDLINYHVPNPIDFFYDRYNFPLRVYGGDSRALLMDPVTYSVKNLAGGDASEDEKEDERKDFRPTAFFEPVLVTDEKGEASVSFTMPDSLTTYRITAFGVKDDVFALKENEVKVQNPVNIQQVQPRRLRERDTAECGVLISNLGARTEKIDVSLAVLSPTEDTEQDKLEGRHTVPGKAVVDGAATHAVSVASGQSVVVYFDVAAQTEGTVNLVYTIKSDALNEKLVSPIRIEKTFVYETVSMTGTVSGDKKDSEKESVIIPGFAKEGRGDLKVVLDATRLGPLGGSVNYLFDYPYGCLEQQSSRILPLIIFEDYIDVFGLDSKVSDIKTCVKAFTQKWGDYQHADGGFGYWPDSEYSNRFVSLRIAYIYALALQKGYTKDDIPINIDSLLEYLKAETQKLLQEIQKDASLHNSNIYDYEMAFTCYVFTLLKNRNMDTVRDKMFERIDELPLDAASYLALSYANSSESSNMEKAKSIVKKIRSYLQPVQKTVTISKKAKSGYWFWYNSETVEYAAILSALVTVNPDDQMVDRLINSLLLMQSHGRWQNTITTSSVLESIYAYIKNRNLDSTDYTAEAKLAGKELLSGKFEGVAAKPKTLTLPFEDEFISSLPRDKSLPVEFSKDGKGYLFYTVEMKYALPDESIAARNEGLGLTYEITDFETGELINTAKETSDVKLVSGKLYKAKVYVESTRNHEYVAVRTPIPSGAEILDSTFVTSGSAAQGKTSEDGQPWYYPARSRISHKNITDNEIQYFWDRMGSGRHSFEFTFRAVRSGVYPTPPVQGECMYENEVFGRTDGYLFIIE